MNNNMAMIMNNNIGMQMNNNIGMQMNNNNMQMNNIMGFGMPIDNSFGIPMNNNVNENNDHEKIINVTFKTLAGINKIFVFDYGTTISDMLRKYLEEIKRPDLINKNEISFLFNAHKLNFGDHTKIEDIFKDLPNPIIIVNDTIHLIG